MLSRIAVRTEPKVIQIEIDPDARLAAGAGGVAHFAATAAGFEPAAAEELQSAVIQACVQAFANMPGDRATLRVAVSRFASRVEVALFSARAAEPIARLMRNGESR